MDFENINIGIDIEKIERFEKYSDKQDLFIKKYFSPAEIEYCYRGRNYAPHLAAAYCAKEACVKALSALGFDGYYYNDFEVLHKESGAPYINLLKEGNFEFKLSLTHCSDTAAAFVIVRKV